MSQTDRRPGRVLLVAHALPPEEASGTPLVTAGYATTLADRGWAVTVLAASPTAPPWDAVRVERWAGEPFDRVMVRPSSARGLPWTVDAAVAPVIAQPAPPGARRSTDPGTVIAGLLRGLRPDVVHIVDNVHLPLGIGELAHALDIAVVRTVSCTEDLCALIAPVSPLAGPDGYCPAPLTPERCADCVAAVGDEAWSPHRATGLPELDRPRRDQLLELLRIKRARAVHHFTEVADRVVFASPSLRTYFEQTLPLEPDRVRVVPMGVDVTTAARRAPDPTLVRPATAAPMVPPTPVHAGTATPGPAPTRTLAPAPNPTAPGPASGAGPMPLRLLLLAAADPAKGIAAVVRAFRDPALAGRDDWRLVLAGGGDRSAFGPLLSDPRVHDHGPYHPAQLAALLAGADVGLSTSVFETFHRVTREYLAAGLPVVGARTFGIVDVVVDGHNGLLFEHRVPGALAQAVVRLLDDRALVGRLADGARATPLRSVDDEVDDLQVLYDEARQVTAARTGRRSRRLLVH